MRATLPAAALVGLAVGLCLPAVVGLAGARGQPPPRPPSGPAYEYKVVEFGTGVHNSESADDMTKKLNALAADGWDYAGPVANATDNDRRFLQGFVAFRRPKK
jgi:Domain of unknown function (DUF4177)